MEKHMSDEKREAQEPNVYDVLLRIVGIIGTIVFIPVILIAILAFGYLLIISGAANGLDANAAINVKNTIMEIWRAVLPLANKALSVLSPKI
jgi:hypothetical protein